MLRFSKNFDLPFLIICLTLLASGMLILASVSTAFSQEKFKNPYYILRSQILKGLIPGTFLAVFVFFLDLEKIKKLSFFILILNLIFMGLVFFPGLGIKRLGAARWVNLKFFSFQPSEFLKLSTIFYFSAFLSSKKEKGEKMSFIAFIIVCLLVGVLLVLQPDISTLAIIILVSILIYFLAGNPIWHVILMVGGGMIIGFFLVKFEPYRMNRILAFLNPEKYPTTIGYQINQALISVGSGQILGVGLGMSRQKFGFLPQSISDSIFAIFAEETGFLGCSILIFLFLLFFWRGLKIAKEAKSEFQRLLSLGIIFWIISQTFINISSMIKILPLMGVPLPFVSYGGSALVAELIGVGILLNVSKT